MAAAFLQSKKQNFLWFEGGIDESSKLEHPASSGQSMPESVWMPTELFFGSDQKPYAIPLSTGGMSAHYVGNQYWFQEDTMESSSIDGPDIEALDFVRNVTNARVRCDVFDPRYHSHARHPTNPAPGYESEYSSLNMCMYGHCVDEDSCKINLWYATTLGLANPELVQGWRRGSAYTEYKHLAPSGGPFLGHRALNLRMNGTRVEGVYLHRVSTGDTVLACARRAVILAAGVMGNAPILLDTPGLVDTIPFFAQPVSVYMDFAILSGQQVCDAATISGGTFHRVRQNASGFLSTLAICEVNGAPRIVWATPQAVSPRVRGNITKGDTTRPTAILNLDDPQILQELRDDVAAAALDLFNITNFQLGGQFEYPAFHWTGDATLVRDSRLLGTDNLFIGDAMAVTGMTYGWTSFNARVAGALAALRAIKYDSTPCSYTKSRYIHHNCCDSFQDTYCSILKNDYKSTSCCPNS